MFVAQTTAEPEHQTSTHLVGPRSSGALDTEPVVSLDPSEQEAQRLIPQGTQFICLIAATSPHIYYQKNSPLFPENQSEETRKHFSEREEARTAILIEEERVTGPDYRMVSPGGVPAKAIQMGSYNMTSVENEIEIGKWYAQIRLPFVSEVKGAIRARKMVSTVGWAKHSVLYEFTSHEDRRNNIVREFDPFSKKTIGETIHAPGSPSIGHRIWPPVDE